MPSISDLLSLLNSTETSDLFQEYISSISVEPSTIESSKYSDLKYLNVKEKGISFQFEPSPKTFPEWMLAAIDLYNVPKEIPKEGDKKAKDRRTEKNPFRTFPFLPIRIQFQVEAQDGGSISLKIKDLEISDSTTGMELVSQLGEPSRKGGGANTASGMGPASWMEWVLRLLLSDYDSEKKEIDVKLMVELSGEDARGSERWEAKGGKARWGVLTFSIT